MNNGTLNFYPGPASIPRPVLERIHAEFFNYNNMGMSVMELSHRTDEIQFTIDDTTDRIKKLMGLGHEFEVVLLQGGGSLQFIMVPMILFIIFMWLVYKVLWQDIFFPYTSFLYYSQQHLFLL